MGWLTETHRVISVDCEVTCINVVALEDHFEDLWLVDCAFLHETDDLVLLGDGLLDVVVQLHLDFVLDLAGLVEEVFVFWWVREVLSILSQQVELADVGPRVVPVAHWVHRPNPHVLTTSQQVHPVDFPVKILPVQGERDPSEAVGRPEHRQCELPVPHHGIDEEQVPGKRNGQHVCAVWVLQVDRAVLNVVATPQEQLTFAIELQGL